MEFVQFKEQQKYRKWEVLTLLFVMIGGLGWVLLSQTIGYNTSTKFPPSISLVLILILISITLVLLRMKLVTKITRKGIQYQYAPFHTKSKKIRWKEVKEVELIQSKQWKSTLQCMRLEFAGRFLNMDSDTGMIVKLKNGRRVFIGSKKEENLKASLESVMQYLSNR